MKFDDDGKVRLDTRRYRITMMIEMDIVSDLGVTPKEMIDQIRGGMLFKKIYDGLHIVDVAMDYEVHVQDDSVELVEV